MGLRTKAEGSPRGFWRGQPGCGHAGLSSDRVRHKPVPMQMGEVTKETGARPQAGWGDAGSDCAPIPPQGVTDAQGVLAFCLAVGQLPCGSVVLEARGWAG